MRKILALALLVSIAPLPSSAAELGTTFPYVHLRQSGKDWRAALDAADELGLKVLRIGAYWSEIEKEEGRFDFSELEEVLERAGAKGYKIVLTVGMKAPVWPEFYIPGWALPKKPGKLAELSRDQKLRERTLRFVLKTVRRAAKHDSIVAWQVENEPMDRAGEHRWFIGADFVDTESRLIRMADPRGRPLVINVWSDNQLFGSAPWTDATYAARNALRLGDILGVDVYPRIDGGAYSKTRTETFPRLYAAAAGRLGKEAWIIESQAEGWGKTKIGPDDVRDLVEKHVEQGYSTILLWGFQSWYEAKLKGDEALWNAVAELSQPAPRLLAGRISE